MRVTVFLALLLSSPVHAETVLLHPPEQAAETLLKAVRLTHEAESEFVPFTIRDLLTLGHPRLLDAKDQEQALIPCPAQDRTQEPPDDLARQVRSAIRRVEYEQADRLLVDLDRRLACEPNNVRPETVSELYFLKGFTSFQLQDLASATDAFRLAITWDPALAWDNNYPPDAAPLFYTLREKVLSEPKNKIRLLPDPLPAFLRIDGRLVSGESVSLTPGRHLVELLGPPRQAWWMEASAESPLTLVVPTFAGSDWAEAVLQRDRWEDLDRLLGCAINQGTSVVAAVGGRLYASTVGEPRWRTLRDPRLAARVTTLSGGALLVGGTALAATSWTKAVEAIDAANRARSLDDYQPERDRYEDASEAFATSRWIAGGGALVLGTGLYLYFRPTAISFAPRFTSDGVGFQVTLRSQEQR